MDDRDAPRQLERFYLADQNPRPRTQRQFAVAAIACESGTKDEALAMWPRFHRCRVYSFWTSH
jgi:hypothetical protein